MDKKKYMEQIIEEMKNKVNNHIVSNEYAKGYCYGLLDYLIDNDEEYDSFSRDIDDMFNL